MVFSELIKENRAQFCDKVKFIAEKIGIDASWLMGVMWVESRLNHRAINPVSKATGLIQFMPKTAISLGTTTQILLALTNVEQLDFVLKYLMPYMNKIKSFTDLYLTVFFPAAIGKPGNFVLQTKRLPASLIAKQNKCYDINGDFLIEKQEIERVLQSKLRKYKAELWG
jgi:hypothetical protein